RQVAGASSDGTVRVWDTETGELLRTLAGQGNPFFRIAWSGDGNHLAATEGELQEKGFPPVTVIVWEARSWREVTRLTGLRDLRPDRHAILWRLSWSADGCWLACSIGEHLKVWERDTWQERFDAGAYNSTTQALGWVSNGRRLAYKYGPLYQIWDPLSGESARSDSSLAPEPLEDWYLSPNGHSLAVSRDVEIQINRASGSGPTSPVMLRGHTEHARALAW